MSRVSAVYGSKYMAASDPGAVGPHRTALIRGVQEEAIGFPDREMKLVVTLGNSAGQKWSKPVVLNKGNAVRLAAAFGDDTADWIGRTVEIWSEYVQFQG